jgi:hypothetical protein
LERACVYCAVRTVSWNTIQVNFLLQSAEIGFVTIFVIICKKIPWTLKYLISSVYHRETNCHWIYAVGSVTSSIHLGLGPFNKNRLSSAQCSLYLDPSTWILFFYLWFRSLTFFNLRLVWKTGVSLPVNLSWSSFLSGLLI